MDKGILYGVGVGPGDPSLMTTRAKETIERCHVVAAPRTGRRRTVALDIAKAGVDLSGKTIIPLDFAMSMDPAARQAAHRIAADSLKAHLDAGVDVAMLDLGDVSIYASLRYISDILCAEGYRVGMVPGVPSFCAAAAELGISLTDMNTPIHIFPNDVEVTRETLSNPGAYIWMKTWRKLSDLIRQLREYDLAGKAMLAQNCGMPDQRLYVGLDEIEPEASYFSIVILKIDAEGEA